MQAALKSLAVLCALSLPSHAIFGIGGHWAPALGLEVKASRDSIFNTTAGGVFLDEKGTTGLSGFGMKIWIDALPLVDLEATGNLQFGYYDANLVIGTSTTSLSYDLDMPFLKGKPFFARTMGDLAVLYPFLKFPPMISLIRLQAGAGLTFGAATQTMSAKFARAALAGNSSINSNSTQAEIGTALAGSIVDEGLVTGMGGFIQLGAKAKPPVIPVGAYLDFKYHFLGFNPDLVGGGLTMELGAALAF